jgi:hypothetical protein
VTIFDLAFIVLFLTGAGTLVAAAVAALGGRRVAARARVRRLGLGAAAYLGVVAIVSVAAPRRFVGLGDDQCSDDWCIAATGVQRRPGPAGLTLDVTFRISSRARRVAQRERNVVVYLRDGRGHRYDPGPEEGGVPFDVRLEPLQQVTTTRAFTVPAGASDVGLVIARGGFPFPGCCIIGDEGSLLHKRTIVRLDAPPGVSAARRPLSPASGNGLVPEPPS